jgi:D-glycero-D-manno-heptose 1,7-bisphosphate phosphatase
MKRKAVFFDRDNTLIVSDGYLGDPSKVQLIDGAADAVARVKSLGYLAIVFSNQSGVARGMFDESAVQAVNAKLDALLKSQNPGGIIDRHEYCPFHPEASVERYRQDSELRKPKAGMIYRAHHALELDLQNSWVIGDAPRDIEAGRTAGCRTILFQDPNLSMSPDAQLKTTVRADAVAASLNDAVNLIAQGIPRIASAFPPPPANGKPEVAAPPATNSVEAKSQTLAEPNRLETLATQILHELRRRHEREHTDFSLSKLIAGMVQVIVIATLFVAYLSYQNPTVLTPVLLLSVTLQMLVVALLLMGKH